MKGGNFRRSSVIKSKPYILHLLVSYFNKVKFPKYRFDLNTFYRAIYNSITKKGTSYNINFIQIKEFSSFEEFLKGFVSRKEYVNAFFESFVKNFDGFSFVPQLTNFKEGQIIRDRRKEKKLLFEQKIIEKFGSPSDLQNDADNSFEIKREIKDSSTDSEEESNYPYLNNNNNNIQKENIKHFWVKNNRDDSINSVEGLIQVIKSSKKEELEEKKNNDNTNKNSNFLFLEKETENGIIMSKKIREDFQRKSPRHHTKLRLINTSESPIKKKGTGKGGFRFSIKLEKSPRKSIYNFFTPKDHYHHIKFSQVKSNFHFNIPDFDLVYSRKFKPIHKFLITHREKKEKEKTERKILVDKIVLSARESNNVTKPIKSLKGNHYILKSVAKLPQSSMINDYQSLGPSIYHRLRNSTNYSLQTSRETYTQTQKDRSKQWISGNTSNISFSKFALQKKCKPKKLQKIFFQSFIKKNISSTNSSFSRSGNGQKIKKLNYTTKIIN